MARPSHADVPGLRFARDRCLAACGVTGDSLMSIRVVLADDHVLLRQGLRMLLEREADIEVVPEAEDGQTAIDQVLEHLPDVVLMDLDMPEFDGLDATAARHASRSPSRHFVRRR